VLFLVLSLISDSQAWTNFWYATFDSSSGTREGISSRFNGFE
jgi:hypothetical protein